ncbi:MAG TPA: glycosyltransferase [Vicinamibacterales bacterium]|jgi:cellulose synthase/poly-beta-1,6-N-acetylglucosamine synthase-like glycosyltransferase|nr:glycosyltransferase [Vicinamibacterales bacterium]
MNVVTVANIFGWAALAYLVGINAVYLVLNVVSFVVLRRHKQRGTLGPLSTRFSSLEVPVSLLIPAYNEEHTVVATVRSLLQLNYSHFEIVVINDGSSDRTLNRLKEAFDLQVFPEVVRRRLATEPIRAVYRSPIYPELKVIDKHNGGKADALNAGINTAQYPLYCALDADGVLRPDSLQSITRPFLDDPLTVAAGGIIRIANGCDVVNGWLVRTGLPRRPLPMLQVVEYCRAFLFGRLGWNPVNGLLVISGAFGVFHKETVIEAGGYRRNTIGEDMELVVRLHRFLGGAGRPYRIVFAPEPVCWTEAPESIGALRTQRIRWQRGLCESLWLNRQLLFSRRGGWAGWVAFPFALLFECLSPVVEALGWVYFGAGFLAGFVGWGFALAFLIVNIGFGTLLSVSSLLLDEISYHTYPRFRQILALLVAATVENLGYRQMTAYWRLVGLVHWIAGTKAHWGDMKRTAEWSSPLPSPQASTTNRT